MSASMARSGPARYQRSAGSARAAGGTDTACSSATAPARSLARRAARRYGHGRMLSVDPLHYRPPLRIAKVRLAHRDDRRERHRHRRRDQRQVLRLLVDGGRAGGLSRQPDQQFVTQPEQHIGRARRGQPTQLETREPRQLFIDEPAHDVV